MIFKVFLGTDGLDTENAFVLQVDMAVLEVFCSLIGWSSLYLLFCWTFAQQDSEWKCRLVTLSHGVVIVPLTAYVVFIDGPWPLTHAGQQDKTCIYANYKVMASILDRLTIKSQFHNIQKGNLNQHVYKQYIEMEAK